MSDFVDSAKKRRIFNYLYKAVSTKRYIYLDIILYNMMLYGKITIRIV